MIVCTIVINSSEADRLKVIKSFVPLIGLTRVQTGCRVCSLLFDCEDPLKLVLWEEWDTREHLERHLRSAGLPPGFGGNRSVAGRSGNTL